MAFANPCAGVLGERMVGAGFGGCMLALLESADVAGTVARLLDGATALLGARPWNCLVEPAGAAGEVSVALAALAGGGA